MPSLPEPIHVSPDLPSRLLSDDGDWASYNPPPKYDQPTEFDKGFAEGYDKGYADALESENSHFTMIHSKGGHDNASGYNDRHSQGGHADNAGDADNSVMNREVIYNQTHKSIDGFDAVFDAINSHPSLYVKEAKGYTSRVFDKIFSKVDKKESVLQNKTLNDADFLAAKPMIVKTTTPTTSLLHEIKSMEETLIQVQTQQYLLLIGNILLVFLGMIALRIHVLHKKARRVSKPTVIELGSSARITHTMPSV